MKLQHETDGLSPLWQNRFDGKSIPFSARKGPSEGNLSNACIGQVPASSVSCPYHTRGMHSAPASWTLVVMAFEPSSFKMRYGATLRLHQPDIHVGAYKIRGPAVVSSLQAFPKPIFWLKVAPYFANSDKCLIFIPFSSARSIHVGYGLVNGLLAAVHQLVRPPAT